MKIEKEILNKIKGKIKPIILLETLTVVPYSASVAEVQDYQQEED